jgi:hypothetical protein
MIPRNKVNLQMLKTLIIVILCFCCITLRSKDTCKKDTLIALQINNMRLLSVLDSVINFEKRCDYYKPDLLFFIHIYSAYNSSWIQVGSYGFELMNLGKHNLGFFIYKNHFFLVTGQFWDETLFSKTKEKKAVKYYEPRTDGVIDVYEDDSFTFWIYKYVNEGFIYNNQHTFCK